MQLSSKGGFYTRRKVHKIKTIRNKNSCACDILTFSDTPKTNKKGAKLLSMKRFLIPRLKRGFRDDMSEILFVSS